MYNLGIMKAELEDQRFTLTPESTDYLLDYDDVMKVIRRLDKDIRKKITDLERVWKQHLEDDGGSCYCLASDESCIPQRIKDLKEVL